MTGPCSACGKRLAEPVAVMARVGDQLAGFAALPSHLLAESFALVPLATVLVALPVAAVAVAEQVHRQEECDDNQPNPVALTSAAPHLLGRR
jgi:hypothetical protein